MSRIENLFISQSSIYNYPELSIQVIQELVDRLNYLDVALSNNLTDWLIKSILFDNNLKKEYGFEVIVEYTKFPDAPGLKVKVNYND